MTPGLLAGLSAGAAVLAAAVTAVLIRVLRPLLVRYALARPNARSSHRTPTPQGGGIAVVAATLLAAAGPIAVLGGLDGLGKFALLAGAVVGLAALGGLDDVRPLSPALRLLLQFAGVTLAVVALDARPILPFLPLGLERALLILAGAWWVNAVNFMDGIDWMTVAEFVPMTGTLAILGVLGAAPAETGLLAAALLGGLLGFAPANRPVARLFLGDVGSLPIGLITGALLLALASAGHLAAALLLPLYYLADATLTLLRRLLRGERVWEAHRTHFYQRATENGFSVREIDARVFGLNLALCGLAALTVARPGWSAPALLAGAALVGWTLHTFARPRST